MYDNLLKQMFCLIMVIATTIMIVPAVSNAQTIPDIPKEVENYECSMKEIQKSAKPIDLENIFKEGLLAAKVLTAHEKSFNWTSKLVRFDLATFEKTKHMMIGFWVNREEVIIVKPDPFFFVKLAEEKGTEVDRIFFSILQKTYPGWFPVYMRQQSDFGGCIIFDGTTLLETYGIWVGFQKNYPESYQEKVQEELKKIEDYILAACICDGEDNYWQELQNFVKIYPDLPITKSVSSRLEMTDKSELNLRFHCIVAH